MTIKMTKAEALAIQAKQVEHYAQLWGDEVRAVVAAATKADALVDGVEYSVIELNRYIPRGGAIESLMGRYQHMVD